MIKGVKVSADFDPDARQGLRAAVKRERCEVQVDVQKPHGVAEGGEGLLQSLTGEAVGTALETGRAAQGGVSRDAAAANDGGEKKRGLAGDAMAKQTIPGMHGGPQGSGDSPLLDGPQRPKQSPPSHRPRLFVILSTLIICCTLVFCHSSSRADLYFAHFIIFWPVGNRVDFQRQPIVQQRASETERSVSKMDWFQIGPATHQLFDMIWQKQKDSGERDIRLLIAKRECIQSDGSWIIDGKESPMNTPRYKKGFIRPQDDFASVYDEERMEQIELQAVQYETLAPASIEFDQNSGAEYVETWEACDEAGYEILKPWSSGTLETRAFATNRHKPLAASSTGQFRERKLVELTSQFPDQNFSDIVCHAVTEWNLERLYLSEDRITVNRTPSGRQELLMHGIGNPRYTDVAVESNIQSLTDLVADMEFSGEEKYADEVAQCGRDTITNIISYGILIAVAAYGAQTALNRQILDAERSWRSTYDMMKYGVVQRFLAAKLEEARRLKLKLLMYITITSMITSLPLFLAIRGEMCFRSINVQEGKLISFRSGSSLEHIQRVVPPAHEAFEPDENCRPINNDPKNLGEGEGQCDSEACIKHENWTAISNFYIIMSTRPRTSNIGLIIAVAAVAAAITFMIVKGQLQLRPVDVHLANWTRGWTPSQPLGRTYRFVLVMGHSRQDPGGHILATLEA